MSIFRQGSRGRPLQGHDTLSFVLQLSFSSALAHQTFVGVGWGVAFERGGIEVFEASIGVQLYHL